MSLFTELKRRNVFRVGIAYLVLGWLLLQVTDVVVPILELPDWVARLVLFLLLLGFPLILFFAWAFELTPEGVKREKDVDRDRSIAPQTGKKLDRAIIGILVVAVAVLLFDRIRIDEPEPAAQPDTAVAGDPLAGSTETPVMEDKSVAVLPFVAMSSGPDDEYFADGLTEEILNSLAQLPELLVTARTSAFSFKGQDLPIVDIAAALGVGHIVEGSVRRSGDRLRVTAQLIRAADGFHLWSENYDSTEEDTIAVQEDIAEKIAQAMDIVLNDEMRERMRRIGLRDVEAFVAYQKAEELYQAAHGDADVIDALRAANAYYEAVLERVPDFVPAHVSHSDLYIHILNNDATDQPMPNVTEEDIRQALPRAQADYAAAVRYARSPSERHNAEFDQAFLSGSWRGLKPRIEAVLDDRGCLEPNWLDPIIPLTDYAGLHLERLREIRQCNPLVSASWFGLARATLWSGDVDGALATAREGVEVAPGGWLTHTLIRALTAKGLYDEAEREINNRVSFDADVPVFLGMVAAARGDRPAAQTQLEQFLQHEFSSGFWAQMMHAWLGNREEANRYAAKFDAHPHGNFSLALMIAWCVCGAPWDLEATPNFAAAVGQAGFNWPPASPIEFPLKDW
jgi:TolB-like protein